MSKVSYLIYVAAEDQELHIAMLYESGVDSFIQSEDHLEAFVDQNLVELQTEIENYCESQGIAYLKKHHDEKDWNAVWESAFQAIKITDELLVRAPFHEENPSVKHELIIAPKMAFGTGHHETTAMILEWMTTMKFDKLNVLDFGCGTGILGMYALMKGADKVVFVDNDPLAVENTCDNLVINHMQEQDIILGGIHQIPDSTFDIILANITRNVLIESLPILAKSLRGGGFLALSGFLDSDSNEMELQLQKNELNLIAKEQKADWICLIAGT